MQFVSICSLCIYFLSTLLLIVRMIMVILSSQIYVLRDSDLLRFVFRLTPGEVRRRLETFSKELEGVLPVAASLNIYETAYYSDVDGAIDFSSTG